jgi:pyridoxamine 5'-phosphate oxidase
MFDFKIDPLENFLKYYREAQIKGVPEANAMALATVNSENQPSVRIVLYKGLINRGFSFFTNYAGRKGRDLESNPKVAANFFWPHLDQQIRLEGVVEKLPRAESEKYFASRPRLSQIGAWASHQSEALNSLDELKAETARIEKQYAGQAVPCPAHWGGYIIVPSEIEFWFGRQGRLHERYVYQKTAAASDWKRLIRSP